MAERPRATHEVDDFKGVGHRVTPRLYFRLKGYVLER